MNVSNLRNAGALHGQDLREYSDAQIESATALVALQTTHSDPHFVQYVASIVAEMPRRHAASWCECHLMGAGSCAMRQAHL